jgi:hypothetical protein
MSILKYMEVRVKSKREVNEVIMASRKFPISTQLHDGWLHAKKIHYLEPEVPHALRF